MKKTNLLFMFFVAFFAIGNVSAQVYCTDVGPSSTADSNLGNVALTGDGGSSFDYTPPCPGITDLDDQTALSADITAGTGYTGSVTWGTCGGTFGNSGTIWIDYNANGVFEVFEVVHTFDGLPTVTEAFSFTLPVADAVNGPQRMRVMQRETSIAPPLDPCATYSWGAVVDLTINISGATGTPAPVPVCSAGPSSTADSNLGGFSLTGESNNIDYTPPCPGITGVDDQTALFADLFMGGTYGASVTWATCGGTFGNSGTIWIDWNQNNIFELDEVVHTFDGLPTVTEPFSVTVPATAPTGTTLMRVMQRETSIAPPLDPCATYSWGSVVDFSVEVNYPPCDDGSDLLVINVDDTTAEATFNSNGNNANIEVTEAGAGQGNNVVFSATGVTSPVSITGLTGLTTYDVYMQVDCGPNQSGYIGPVSFTTLRTPVISIVDSSGNGLPNINDPCDCDDQENITDIDTKIVTWFHDFVTIHGNPGETWTVSNYTGGQMYSDPSTPIPTGTALTEVSPGFFRIDFLHENGVGFAAEFNRITNPLATALAMNNTCDGVFCSLNIVPTMGEWGMIMFALIMLSFGVVYVMRQQVALAGFGSANINASAFNQKVPFEKSLFRKLLFYVMIALAVAFTVAVTAFGYEMTSADVPGSLLAGPMLAYFIHLLVLSTKQEEV